MLTAADQSFIKTHLSFYNKLTQEEKNLLLNHTTKVHYDKGHNLHNAESECLGVLIILEGELRAYILSEDGREFTLYRLSAGETCVLSASCIINTITFDVHIDAEVDTTVYLINIGAFSKLSDQNIYVENYALKNTTEKFSDVMWAMEQVLFTSFDRRLAIFLLDEMARTNSPEIKLSQEQIAKYIGSAREVVSRMLKVFQNQGILDHSRGLIRILDKEKLKNLIET